MLNGTSQRLQNSIDKIMYLWEERALAEIKAANHQETLALRDSLPEYLSLLVDALSVPVDRSQVRKRLVMEEVTRIGKKHGSERATSLDYTMDQMILEYHILRQVIFDVLEEDEILNPDDREIVVCSIEQAVNDAATQFSDSLRDLQEHFAHILAHDLRNPLNTAKVSTQMILREPGLLESCDDLAKNILKSIHRIDKMIGELLNAGRIKAGLLFDLEFKDCDLDWLIRDVTAEANLAHQDRIRVVSLEKCLGFWNEDGLRRLMENLLTNAVKHGQENSPITVSLTQDEASATFSIHNDGLPIPAEEHALLFQKFRRSRSAENKVGWGLGLTVVKGVVEAHKGSIKVESEEGRGTRFVVNLPKDLRSPAK